jgi:hypothetical protein
MNVHDSPPTRPTAAWISRRAAGLLSSTPGLLPLEAVRLAMDACTGAADERFREPASKRSARARGGQR